MDEGICYANELAYAEAATNEADMTAYERMTRPELLEELYAALEDVEEYRDTVAKMYKLLMDVDEAKTEGLFYDFMTDHDIDW